MQIRITLLIINFIYIMLTNVVYFSKNRIDNTENTVYEKLLSITPIGLLLELGCNLTAIYDMNEIITNIISRLYLIFIIVWLTIFTLYILTITIYKEDTVKKYKNKKARRLLIIGCIFVSLLLIVLPIKFVLKENSAYLGGVGITILATIASFLIILNCLLFVKYFKKMSFREKVPMLMLLILIIGLLLLNNFVPEIQMISSSFALITIIMYFTIENPDKKLLEAIHKSKKTANDANLEKSMLVYNMMSEVKQIATDVNRYSNIILNSTNLEETKFFAREIIAANSRLYTMSNKIYNIDEIEVKKIKTINTKYNIKLVLKEIITIYKKKLQDKNINFRINIDNNIPNSLYGDSINLKEALNILMTKTYKDTEKGFIELSVSSISKYDIARIIIKIEASNNKIINNDLEQDKDISKTREILSAIGGSVITTNNTNGNTITIILDQKINKKELPLEDKYDKYLNNKKILVVDDNEASLKLIEKILTKYNIKVETVSLGKLALDKIRRKEKYDLILVDEEMPYIDGEELMYKLNKIEGFNTKVILLTKNNNVIYDDYYKDKGFSDYILKPIDKRELINKILDNTK